MAGPYKLCQLFWAKLSVSDHCVGLGLGITGLGAAAAVWSGWSGKQEAIDGTPGKSLDNETLR